MQMTSLPEASNVIGPVDFLTITTLRRSIKDAQEKWSSDYRFQAGIEKEKDLLKYFMSMI